MQVDKIGAKTLSLLKREQEVARKNAKKIAEEQRFEQYIKSTAQSILPKFSKYQLKVNSGDSFNPSESLKYQISKLEYSDSVWAPWSFPSRKNLNN